MPNDHVAKIGRTTGLTTGTVTSVHAIVSVATSNAETILLQDCIEFTPERLV